MIESFLLLHSSWEWGAQSELCRPIIISFLWVLLKSSLSAFTHMVSPASSPSGHHHCPLLEQWEATLIKVLCPIQDWRKSDKFRECPEKSNKHWLNRPSEERLRESGLLQLELLVGGNNRFSRNKRMYYKTLWVCWAIPVRTAEKKFWWLSCLTLTIRFSYPLCPWDCNSYLLSENSLLYEDTLSRVLGVSGYCEVTGARQIGDILTK